MRRILDAYEHIASLEASGIMMCAKRACPLMRRAENFSDAGDFGHLRLVANVYIAPTILYSATPARSLRYLLRGADLTSTRSYLLLRDRPDTRASFSTMTLGGITPMPDEKDDRYALAILLTSFQPHFHHC